MTTTVSATVSGSYIWPQSIPTSIGGSAGNPSYVYYLDSDRYSASIPASLGTNVNSSNVSVGSKAIGTNQSGITSPIDRSFDRSINWNNIETSAGVFDWTAMDAWVASCVTNKKEMLYTVFGTPSFYTSSVDTSTSYGTGAIAFPDLNSGALGTFVTTLVTRYKNKGTPIPYIEIWNEPKYSSGNASYFLGTPTQLAQIARIVNQAAKAVDSTIKIVGVGPTGMEAAWTYPTADASGSDYLNKFLAASDGAAGTGKLWVDIISIHSYSHSGYNNLFAIPQMYANVQAALVGNGMSTSTPIWVTETSAITPALNTLTETDQINYMKRSLVLHLAAGFQKVYWYGFGPLALTTGTGQAAWNSMAALLNGATIGPTNYQLLGNNSGKVDWQTVGQGNTYGNVWTTINGTQYRF
jgi:O-Glycosyl hydrolase family 30